MKGDKNPLFGIKLKQLRKEKGYTQSTFADALRNKFGLKTDRAVVGKWEIGYQTPEMYTTKCIAELLGVSIDYLTSFNDAEEFPIGEEKKYGLNHPIITSETVVFPVVGSIAAGYDEIAVENWSGETVEIPLAYLKGRKKEEFFVLSVKGDSMYPLYMDGDKVLILRQSTLNYSGEIGAVLYEGENATLKKVEYVYGEDWMRLVPINPEFKPKLIENSDLEQCRVLGIPRLLIREI